MSRTTDPGTGSGTTPVSAPDSAPKPSASSSSTPAHHSAKHGTPEWFARQVLKGLGLPTSSANVQWLVSWQSKEGGHWENTARYNPLNTTLDMPGSGTMNGVGVRVYTSWQQGIEATIKTLQAGRYSDIRNALASGHVSLQQHFQSLLAWSGNGYDNVGGGDPHYSPNGSGFSGGGGGGAGAGNAEFSKADLSGMLDDLGLPKALISSNPGLQAAFQKIVKQKLDLNTEVGKARAMAIFKGTDWWKNHNASQRKYLTMQYDDHSEYLRQLKQKTDDIQSAANGLGVHLNDKSLGNIAHMALMNGLDDNELSKVIAGHFEYHRNSAYGGEAGADITGLQKLAADYYTNLSPDRIQGMTQRLLANGQSADTLAEYFKQQALSRFPHLKPQLDQGFTISDIAQPYVSAVSSILELPQTGIKPQDPHVMKALQMPDDKGGFQLMPEWQFEQSLRNDPLWLKTQNAQNSLMDTGAGLLRSMGLMV